MFDAYNVKKVLPRLFIAVILIQLSWFIFTGVISIMNSIAYGLEGLMYAPFGGYEGLQLQNILAGQGGASGLFLSFSTVGVGALAVGALAVGGIVTTGGIILLGVFIAFALLLFRQVIIVALLIISPLALVAWVMPGTEKYWKLWWESFSKLLLVYPIILGMLAAGRVLGATVANVDPASGAWSWTNIDSITNFFLVIACIFGPFYLIPKTFQMAGGAFQTLTGTINNKSRGAFDRLKNRRKKTQARTWEDTKSGNRFKSAVAGGRLDKLNQNMGTLAHANKAGLRPGSMRANMREAAASTSMQEIEKNMRDNEDYQTWKADDDLNRAAAESSNEAELRANLRARGRYSTASDAELDSAVARVQQVRKSMSSDAFRRMTTRQAIAGGTAYDDEAEAIRAIAAASGGSDSVLATMTAQMRSDAMAAGRVDHGGAGFGDTFNLARAARDNPGLTDEEINRTQRKNVLKSQGAGVLTHASMKKQAITNLMPEIQSRLTDAIASGDTDRIDSELANIANIQDGLASSSPQLADEFANGIMGAQLQTGELSDGLRGAFGDLIEVRNPDKEVQVRDPATGNMTRTVERGEVVGSRTSFSVRQLMESRRGSGSFQDKRRELNSREFESGAGRTPAGPGGPTTKAPTSL